MFSITHLCRVLFPFKSHCKFFSGSMHFWSGTGTSTLASTKESCQRQNPPERSWSSEQAYPVWLRLNSWDRLEWKSSLLRFVMLNMSKLSKSYSWTQWFRNQGWTLVIVVRWLFMIHFWSELYLLRQLRKQQHIGSSLKSNVILIKLF